MARLLPLLRPVGAAIFSAGIIAACAEGGALPVKKPLEDGGAAGTGSDASANGGSGNGGAAGSGVGAMGGDTVGGDGGNGGSSTAGTTSGGSAGDGGTSAGGSGNGGSGNGGSGNGGSGNGGSGGAVNGGAAGSGNAGSGGSGNAGSGAGGSGGTACEIAKYNFDACNDGWVMTGSGDWACGVPSSGPGADHTSGAGKAWSTSPSGNQGTCDDAALESPVIDLSAGGQLRLRFWHWYSFRVCDGSKLAGLCNLPCGLQGSTKDSGGIVEVKDSGGNWVKVAPPSGGDKIDCYSVDSDGGQTCSPCGLDGQRGYTGASGGWVQQEIDISAYAHANFQVRFHTASYASDPCNPPTPGWTVDDVRVAPSSCP